MGQLWIKETHINATEGYQYYQGQWYEAQQETIEELFRDLQKEFGRAESKMYRDQKEGPPVQVGWVFGKRVAYEGRGPKKKYHREVWVEVSTVEPMRKTIWLPAPVSPWQRGKGKG